MAIYHAHVSSGSRAGGQSGAAKAAYVLREGKYAGRDDLVVSGHGNLPAWAGGDPRALFAAADLHERANARLFLEIEVALPNELDESQQHELVRAIAGAVTAPGLPFTYAIHAGRPKSAGEPANPHAHILISERVNDGVPRDAEQWFRRANRKRPELGGAAKHRDLKERSWVDDTRKLIAGLMNEHLEQARSPARVTSDSHATRIAQAVASGDVETAEYLRRHPPGIHLGPTLAALERDRFRQGKGEEPELSRAGEPTGRGDRHRAAAAEAERIREGMGLVTTASGRAREELQRAAEAVDAARSAGLSDGAIVGIYEESESAESGSGWGAVEEVAVETARSAKLGDDEVLRIYERSESAGAGAGWASMETAVVAEAERKAAAEAMAGEFPIDVDALYRSARGRGANPVSVLEEATAAFAAARTALLPDAEVWRLHAASEISEQGSGWTAVKAAASSRQAQKETAEAGAATFGVDIQGVYAGAQAGGADPVVALEEKVAEEERLASERRAAVEQREGSVRATQQGRTWLLTAQREALGNVGGQLTLERREKVVETVYQRVDEALRDREAVLRAIPEASQYLPALAGGAGRLSTLAERESMVMTAEQGLKEELDRREEGLVKRTGGSELLVDAFGELCGADLSFEGSSLSERLQIITLAERWFEEDRVEEEAARSAALDYEEANLRSVSSGAQHLAAAQREGLVEGQDPAGLDARETVFRIARRRVEEEHDGRAAALSARRCAGGSDDVDGAGLYASKLAALEAGGEQSGGSPDPVLRERALVWAEQQMDRLDGLGAEEGLDLFFGKLAALGSSRSPKDVEQSLDDAEEQLRRAAERRRDRVNALSEDERGFYAKRLDAVEPSWRETGTAQSANIDEAIDYARTELAALDRDIERRRVDLHGTPGDGYARLLRAGFESESRQRKVEALTSVETYLHEAFGQQEEKIRTHACGEDILQRARLEVLGAARQPATLTARGAVIEAAEVHLRAVETEQREARHRMVSNTPGGDERLRVAGWEEARTDNEQDRVLATVEHGLAADFDHRERQLRTDDEAFLGRGRVEVLEADREPDTLAERGKVIERAEVLRQAAMAERKRRAEQRVPRLRRLFGAPGGDAAFFTALDARQPSWRERGTAPADIDHALDLAEQRVDRTQPATAEHVVVVNAQQAFSAAPSAAWRQAGDRFPKGSVHARVSQRLADRTRASALASERKEPPASSALVQRLVSWLRVQVDRLLKQLGLVRATAATDKPGHPQVAGTGHRSDTEKARERVMTREVAVHTVPGGRERLHAEQNRIRRGSSRRLSLEERESAAGVVEAWIRAGVRVDVGRALDELRTGVGFAPPVQVLRAVGQELQQEGEYIPGSRPDVFVKTFPEGTGDVPTDEEQTLRAALHEQRCAENDARHQKALEEYRRDLETWKRTGRRWFRSSSWPKPKAPIKQDPAPPSQTQVEQFRVGLVARMVHIVRGRIEQMYSLGERARPIRPGEGSPDRSSSIAHDTPQRQQQGDRDDTGPSR